MLGLFMSSVFPSTLSVAELYIEVTGIIDKEYSSVTTVLDILVLYPSVLLMNICLFFYHYIFPRLPGSLTSIMIVSSASGEMLIPLLVGRVTKPRDLIYPHIV
jgi:hypothetical protein